jgi:gliding motility-associated-like protein
MKQIFFTLLLTACAHLVQAQTYNPITVTGFNNDIVAESGTSAQATTTTVLDLSNYVLYSLAFASTNNIAGGMVDNGAVSNGSHNYQLASYTANNGLYLSAGNAANSATTGTLTLSTPAVYAKVSLLVFSTEGNSSLEVVLKYTDGTTANAGTFSVSDWFYGTNPVYAGFGRVTRQAIGPYAPDGLTTNPQFYPLDLPVDCANQNKLLQSVTVNYVSGTGANSRAVVFAVAGAVYPPLAITPVITPAACGASNGSIKLNTSGGASPLTFMWNTTPAQNTPNAIGLPPGSYTCTITDGNGCNTTYQGTITKTSGIKLTATSSSPDMCTGDHVTLSAMATGGTPSGYTWNPGNMTGSNVTVSPDTTTTYTVTAGDAFGCSSTTAVSVIVKPLPVAAFVATPDTVCVQSDVTVQFSGTADSAAIYDWNNFAGATVKTGAGAGPYTIQFPNTGTYKLQLQVTDNGCVSAVTSRDVTVAGPLEAPSVTVASVTNNSITFTWSIVAGAAAYQVNINGAPYGTPGPGTSCTVTGLQPLQTVTIEVVALGISGCQNSAAGKASGKTLTDQIFIPNSFTPNGDGKNDVFRPYGNAITAMEMKIFNQWGELICESRDISAGWDGTQKGKLQPVGVYTYVIRLVLTDGSEITRKGSVHLIH